MQLLVDFVTALAGEQTDYFIAAMPLHQHFTRKERSVGVVAVKS